VAGFPPPPTKVPAAWACSANERVKRTLDYDDSSKLDREEDEVDINTLDQGNNLYASRFKRRRV